MTSETTAPGSFRTPRVTHARVDDVMHPGVITCAPETPLRDVARTFASKHIHCLVVPGPAETGARPTWSLVTGLDLMAAAADEERTAGDIATEPVTVSSEDRLDHAAQLMAEHKVEHLIVVGAADGRPVGVLSSLDVAGAIAWGEA